MTDTKYVDIEDFMKKAVKESGYIKHVIMGEMLDDVTRENLLGLLQEPLNIELTDKGLVYVNEDGERILCPNYGLNITADGKWLSDKIGPLTIDIDQNGNLRKAEEAQSAYCLITVNRVLNDKVFMNELENIIKNYDFSKMAPNEGTKTFTKFLEEIQDYQSTTINIAVSAAKYNISDIKKDSEKFLKENIPEDRISGLRELSTMISAINRNYSLGELSPESVKNKTKLEILSLMDKRDTEINLILNGGKDANGRIYKAHPESTIFKLTNLSTEYISPIIKRKLALLAEEQVNNLYNENPGIEIQAGEKKNLIDQWKRRYYRLARLSVRKERIEEYISQPESFVMPPKL